MEKVSDEEMMNIDLYGKIYIYKIRTKKSVTWTTMLHQEFTLAYIQCIRRRIKPTGKSLHSIMINSIRKNNTDIGIPIECLTKSVINSHLQKYNDGKRLLTKITSDIYDMYREKLEENGLWLNDKKICPKLEEYCDKKLLEFLDVEEIERRIL
jgi:hypothetical protein